MTRTTGAAVRLNYRSTRGRRGVGRSTRCEASRGDTKRRSDAHSARRRDAIVGVGLASVIAVRDEASATPMVFRVPSSECQTIAHALSMARDGDVVQLAAGETYEERVVVDVDGVTIEAVGEGRALVRHVTTRPYESAIEIRGLKVIVRGIDAEHSSKSVANNYGIFVVEGANATFEKCDVRSSTGSGFGVEGAQVELVECSARGCATHGFVGLGDSSGLPGTGVANISRCSFEDNAQDGLLIRGGAVINMSKSRVIGNGRYGVELIDCEG